MAGIQPETMVAPGPFDAPASIVYLSEDHAAGDSATGARIICDSVLGTAKQYISRTCSGNAGQEASPGGTKCQRDVPLRTGTHESGGCSRVGERYNPGQCVEGIPGNFLVFPVCHHIFPVQGKVDVLAGDKESVQQMFHVSSSMAFFR